MEITIRITREHIPSDNLPFDNLSVISPVSLNAASVKGRYPRGLVRAKLYIHRRVSATLAARYLHYEPNCTFTQRDTAKQCKTRVQIWARTSNGTFRCFSVLLPPKMARWVRLTNDRVFVCHDVFDESRSLLRTSTRETRSFRRTPKTHRCLDLPRHCRV